MAVDYSQLYGMLDQMRQGGQAIGNNEDYKDLMTALQNRPRALSDEAKAEAWDNAKRIGNATALANWGEGVSALGKGQLASELYYDRALKEGTTEPLGDINAQLQILNASRGTGRRDIDAIKAQSDILNRIQQQDNLRADRDFKERQFAFDQDIKNTGQKLDLQKLLNDSTYRSAYLDYLKKKAADTQDKGPSAADKRFTQEQNLMGIVQRLNDPDPKVRAGVTPQEQAAVQAYSLLKGWSARQPSFMDDTEIGRTPPWLPQARNDGGDNMEPSDTSVPSNLMKYLPTD